MKLKDSIRVQFFLMLNKKDFKISFTIVLAYCLITYVSNVLSSLKIDISMMYSSDALFALNCNSPFWSKFSVIFPYLVVLPFSFSYIEDNNINIHPYFMQRLGTNQYFKGKAIVSFIGGFIIIFIPFAINIVLNYITFPTNHNTYYGIYNTLGYCNYLLGSGIALNTQYKEFLFLNLYLYSPFLYNLLFLIMCSTFSGILSMASTSFSYISNKIKLAIFVPVFLFFYFGQIANGISYRSDTYINYNWLDYVSIDSYCGKNIMLFLIILLIIVLFSIITTNIICRAKKE